MKVLIVTAHPQSGSFTHALVQSFAEGVAAAGHNAEIADLYGEGFAPLVSPKEMADWQDGRISAEIGAQQRRIADSDGLVLAYPVWWGMPPAMLCGWLQRVLTQGFAFENVGGRTQGLIAKRAQMLVNIGSRQRGDVDLAALYLEPMLAVLRYCGLEILPPQANWGVYAGAGPAALQSCLDLARDNGKQFFA